MAQVVFGFFPAVAFPTQQGTEPSVTQENARLLGQIQPQAVNRPDRKRKVKRARVKLQQTVEFLQVSVVRLRWTTAAVTIPQPCDALFTPAFVPGVDRVTGHQHHLGDLFGRLPQVQQVDGNRSLPNFRVGRTADRFFNLGKLLVV